MFRVVHIDELNYNSKILLLLYVCTCWIINFLVQYILCGTNVTHKICYVLLIRILSFCMHVICVRQTGTKRGKEEIHYVLYYNSTESGCCVMGSLKNDIICFFISDTKYNISLYTIIFFFNAHFYEFRIFPMFFLFL